VNEHQVYEGIVYIYIVQCKGQGQNLGALFLAFLLN
jgi:hypothetical protein